MNKKEILNPDIKRAAGFLSQRKEILAFSPEKAIARIFEAEHPAALVHSFPEADLYFLVNDIGINDSLEIIALASYRQWEYILDIELWEKDRIDLNSATKWLDVFFQAAPARFVRWAVEKKAELIEYYLYKNIKVAVREHDEDPSVLGKDFITFDDVYYVGITDDYFEADESAGDSEKGEEREKSEDLIKRLLEKVAGYDYGKYRDILFETMIVLPAEMEEELYRIRNVRLEEKGFLPFHEAAGVYAPLKPDKLVKRRKTAGNKEQYSSIMPVPLYPSGMLKEDNLFSMSLERIEPEGIIEDLQTEFAALCNRIISADGKTIRNRDELKEIVKKACGYLSIGLEKIAEKGEKPDLNRTAALMEKYHLEHIFRTGFGFAMELKKRAEKWVGKSWFRKQDLPLLFWGEEWTGILGGLLIKKPLYFDNYKAGHLYREFYNFSDVRNTGKHLDEITAIDGLFSLLCDDARRFKGRSLNYKKLILTLFAGSCAGLPKETVILPYGDFVRFFESLWTGKGKSRRMASSVKESFLKWLSESAGLAPAEITEKLGRVFDDLFCEIESELKKVSPRDLDPRHINLFLVESGK